MLHGSRATGDASPASDWDFGYLAHAGFDADALLADLVLRLGTDAIDLADLARASAQLRFRVAQHGQVVVEPRAGAFADFWLDAVSSHCAHRPPRCPARICILWRVVHARLADGRGAAGGRRRPRIPGGWRGNRQSRVGASGWSQRRGSRPEHWRRNFLAPYSRRDPDDPHGWGHAGVVQGCAGPSFSAPGRPVGVDPRLRPHALRAGADDQRELSGPTTLAKRALAHALAGMPLLCPS